jgi:3-hydroxyisobutyrate dehydrogenase
MSEGNAIRPPDAIGFIALGAMGTPMAANVVKAGYKVKAFDVSEAARKRFEETSGIKTVASAAEACIGVKAVITMLADGKVVRQALLADGAAKAASRGTIFIDMSSSSPIDTRTLGPDLAALGMELVDAPVSGGTGGAAAGTLAIMAGGKPDIVERVRPLLQTMGKNVFATGPLGTGHAMKSLNNFVAAAGMAAAMEAMVVGREFGLEPSLVVDILNASTGRNMATEMAIKNQVLTGKFKLGFAMQLMVKDIGIAAELARSVKMPDALMYSVQKRWTDGLKTLPTGADISTLYKFFETQTGK